MKQPAKELSALKPERIPRKKKPVNTKNFGGTPLAVCPVCPMDMSHLSRHMSRLFRGHWPYDGKEWRKYPVVPRAHPSRPLVYAYFNRSGSKAFETSRGDVGSLPLCGGTFVRSYSVSNSDHQIPLCNFS